MKRNSETSEGTGAAHLEEHADLVAFIQSGKVITSEVACDAPSLLLSQVSLRLPCIAEGSHNSLDNFEVEFGYHR